ncbi:hypothetical protein Cpir12675_004990 [Ceratocystis pirilliformis]|uniref:Heat shock factor-binding protein 1 n=3 Tax=Ceratocystis TaxID=5157 RepID=A0A2C5WUF5_9PEZI|nr:hypothetical protein CFIMG_004230RA [Ceratocystis fimbriata CBS 114723]
MDSGGSPTSKPSASRGDAPPDDPHADLNAAVEELLNSLSNKFAGVSSEIFAKMDEMSRRLDSLETALAAKEKTGNENKSS